MDLIIQIKIHYGKESCSDRAMKRKMESVLPHYNFCDYCLNYDRDLEKGATSSPAVPSMVSGLFSPINRSLTCHRENTLSNKSSCLNSSHDLPQENLLFLIELAWKYETVFHRTYSHIMLYILHVYVKYRI